LVQSPTHRQAAAVRRLLQLAQTYRIDFDAERGDSITTLRSDSQLPAADRAALGYLCVALNRHDDGGDRVIFKEPDSLADYEWPPVELVLDHYEACFVGGPLDDARAVIAWTGYE
jgi:hypothetical protein